MQPHNEKEEFKLFLEQKRIWYKKIDRVFCPILNNWVIFNAKGFYHLRYSGTGKMRSEREQYYRLSLLVFCVQVVQEAQEIKEFQERLSRKYWKISSIINNQVIVIILRKTGCSPIIFYSIWRD
jgi:hypothetical protein